ncbi:YcxB family protein [Jeotgalibaca caeni]|uniref:YcxB family protein n=1 Tax=Jeotgalibaca caeni TaxID=3028623 RepID=UPI00237EAC1C|nr:YcxB family protein [Jeotgalibaca caeni]MDE1549607.1 YcxB family protein [Jeotgalibaca caeni]
MKIQFELTEEDYISFNLHHLEHSPSQKRMYQLSRFLLPMVCAVLIYLIGTFVLNQPSAYWIFVAVIFVVVWTLTYPKQHIKLVTKQLKKMSREGDNSTFYGKKTMTISEDTITVEGNQSTEIVAKENIKTIRVHEDMVLLYLSAVSAQIIPTRCLDAATKKQLLETLPIERSESSWTVVNEARSK